MHFYVLTSLSMLVISAMLSAYRYDALFLFLAALASCNHRSRCCTQITMDFLFDFGMASASLLLFMFTAPKVRVELSVVITLMVLGWILHIHGDTESGHRLHAASHVLCCLIALSLLMRHCALSSRQIGTPHSLLPKNVLP